MALSVLIVDDELGLAETIAELLREAGHRVEIAVNGSHGLARLGTRHFDIVLVDLRMPVMDGIELIARMRAIPELAAIPVVLTTSVPEAIPTGDTARHDAVLIKPYSLPELIDLMGRLVRHEA